MHPNRLFNADFSRDLSQWAVTGDVQHVASDGGQERGCARLTPPGASLRQEFALSIGRDYMLELAVKGDAAGELDLEIQDDGGEPVYSVAIPVCADWTYWARRIGLAWGSYRMILSSAGVACQVDDISLAFVIHTRRELAEVVHDRLGSLAAGAAQSPTPDGARSEGDYTYAIDSGLRKIGATDPAGRPDVRYLTEDTLDNAIDAIELEMLHRLHRVYSTRTDYGLGPREEKLSQIAAGIERLLGIAVGGRSRISGRAVLTRRLRRPDGL